MNAETVPVPAEQEVWHQHLLVQYQVYPALAVITIIYMGSWPLKILSRQNLRVQRDPRKLITLQCPKSHLHFENLSTHMGK